MNIALIYNTSDNIHVNSVLAIRYTATAYKHVFCIKRVVKHVDNEGLSTVTVL